MGTVDIDVRKEIPREILSCETLVSSVNEENNSRVCDGIRRKRNQEFP